jgi:hypothetical protein
MPRRFTRNDNWDFGGKPGPGEEETGEPKSRKRRLATTFVFTTLFFAGASLAAVAGNWSATVDTSDMSAMEQTTTSEEQPAVEAAPAESAPAESAPATDDAMASAATQAAASHELSDSADSATAQELAPEAGSDQGFTTADKATAASSGAATPFTSAAPRTKLTPAKKARARTAHLRAVLLPKSKPAPQPEIEGPESAATIWLNSPLPDPTPPAVRLSSKFAANLKVAAKGSGVDWAVMLGILRARGASGHNPADRVTLQRLAARIGHFGPAKGDWATIVSYSGDTHFADKAAALARYNRAVGLNALVKGLEAAKSAIGTRILSDPQISIYDGGRNDIIQGKVDVRVLATISYLRETFGQVTVSCLISGHRLYARPGVISAHIPGHAVDISSLGETSILGHQAPGSITERAVRELLLAPSEIMPRQIISLLGLGGPSFPMGDHYNHIHIGF